MIEDCYRSSILYPQSSILSFFLGVSAVCFLGCPFAAQLESEISWRKVSEAK